MHADGVAGSACKANQRFISLPPAAGKISAKISEAADLTSSLHKKLVLSRHGLAEQGRSPFAWPSAPHGASLRRAHIPRASSFEISEIGRDMVEAAGCSLCLDIIDLTMDLGKFLKSDRTLLLLRQVGDENGKSIHDAAQLTTVTLCSDNLLFGIRRA